MDVAVLVIAGNTGVGKTDLSLHLASLLNGEVVSADSAQVRICRNADSALSMLTRLQKC